jgi:7-cyano-7-deazaguanine synthase in queuosine biosynthesis
MFSKPTFEERKEAEETGNCTCFPENPKNGNCENCYHRKEFLKKLGEESSEGELIKNEQQES